MIWTWFSDPEDTNPSFIQMTRTILILTIAATLVMLILISGGIAAGTGDQNAVVVLIITSLFEIVALVLTLRGRPAMAKEVVPVALLLAITYSASHANGIHDLSMLGFPAAIVVSALLLRNRSIFLATPLAILAIGYIAYADMVGINDSPMATYTGMAELFSAVILIVTISVLLQILIVRFNISVRVARENEQAQLSANADLLSLQESLENRILERTAELSAAYDLNERSTKQFQITAQIARLIANIHEVDQLLPSISSIISDRFGFYHVGIFLLDDARQYVVLSAASSDAGRRLLEDGFRLRFGDSNIVANTANTGLPRLALDSGSETHLYQNSDFPNTRSELALPLKLGELLIGVLDVQSVDANAFIQQDIETLTTLADQVAIAIRNAQLLRDSQAAIAESQLLFGNYINKAWKSASRTDRRSGYRFAGANAIPLETPINTPEIRKVLESGEAIAAGDEKRKGKSALIVPVRLRDETIGTISVNLAEGERLDPDNVDIVRAASERVALALENATLLDDSQRRAAKERSIGEISAKIGVASNMDAILQTAVEELGRSLGNAEVTLELSSNEQKA